MVIRKSILLINYIKKDARQAAGKDYLLYPPLGLAYLSAYLKNKVHRVDILDAIALNYSEREIIEKASSGEYDFVGLTVYTTQVVSILSLCDTIKKSNDSLRIVLGGPHVLHCHEELLKNNAFIDYCIRGEGEQTLLELVESNVNDLPLERVKGLSYRKNGEVKVNPDREVIKDLDSLPFPDRSQLPNHLYSNVGFMGPATGKFTCISMSRGCPFRCKYCASEAQWHGSCRLRSVDNVIEEIIQLQERYGVKVVRFNDDLLTWKKRWIFEFCDKLLARKISIKWYCDARVETVDADMLRMMKKAGCLGIQYGIEFGNERIRRLAGKMFSNEKALNGIKLARQAKLPVFGLFMIGYPDEDESTVMDTIEFAIKSGVNWAGFSVVTPFPGTILYKQCLQEGLLRSNNWEDYNIDDKKSVIRLENLSEEKLSQLLDLAYRKFYFRPTYILYRIFHLSSLKDISSALALLKRNFLAKWHPHQT